MSVAKLQARMRQIAAERAKREAEKLQADSGNSPKCEPKASHTVTEHVEPTLHTKSVLETTVLNQDTSQGSDTGTKPVMLGKSDIDVSMFNSKQLLAVKLAERGKSFCLIGAAGSGKTTTTRGVITTLRDSGAIGKLYEGTEKVLRTGKPSVAVLSYTNQAVRNIKEALPIEFKPHCSTIHKILEYQPEYHDVEVLDDNGQWTGETKKSMYYEPRYGIEPSSENGKGMILPHLDVVIVEEAGSVPVDLWETFLSALPNRDETIFVFLGDLNQLPPVFGDGILGYKLLELPIVELSQVYRNVGLVTQFAHRILEGKPISCQELETKWNLTDDSGSLKFNAFKKKTDPKQAAPTLGKHFKTLVIDGKFNPEEDVLLLPFNKQIGTIAMNKWIMSGIDVIQDRVVHEVLAGYIKSYWALGDKVLHNKQYCRIVDIEPNSKYTGEPVLAPSKHLTRWGRTGRDYEFRTQTQAIAEDKRSVEQMMADAVEDMEEGGTLQASTIITLEATDEALRDNNGLLPRYEIFSAGGINGMLPVHAMSIHKSQGSEWRKVWMILHHSHAVMFQRELLYTGCTRARQDLEVYYSGQASTHKIGGSPFHMGILNQQIEGKTIEHKLAYFKDKVRAQLISESIKAGNGVPPDTIHPTIVRTIEDLEQTNTTTMEAIA